MLHAGAACLGLGGNALRGLETMNNLFYSNLLVGQECEVAMHSQVTFGGYVGASTITIYHSSHVTMLSISVFVVQRYTARST